MTCGKIMKALAVFFCSCCILATMILLLAEFADMRHYLLGSTMAIVITTVSTGIGGCLISLFMYAFGDLVENTRRIRVKVESTPSALSDELPDL